MLDQNNRIILTANSSWNLLNFREPIIRALIHNGWNVSAAVPQNDKTSALTEMGVNVHHVPVNAKGLSPLQDARLLISYIMLLQRVRPLTLLTFTPKANIYGSIAATLTKVPTINTITGLGTTFLSGRTLEAIISFLYATGLRHSDRVFFHNFEDRDLFLRRRLIMPEQAYVVAGSGVNLSRFAPTSRSDSTGSLTFLFVGRFLKDKGVLEFAQAASLLRPTLKGSRFQMLGSLEAHPKAISREVLESFITEGAVEILGSTEDVRPFIAAADCVVLPSYREGLPRVLLEASAMATPVITTNVPGCRQVVDNRVTGLLCEARCAESLAQAMLKMAEMPQHERKKMGLRAREKAERQFSEDLVVNSYLGAVQRIQDKSKIEK